MNDQENNPMTVGEIDINPNTSLDRISITVQSEIFSIKNALALLQDANQIAYIQDTCTNLRINPDKAFKNFVETVANDPMQTFQAFPTRLKKLSALSKPKTGLLNLLKNSTVIQHLGDDICKKSLKGIESAWKANKKALEEARTIGGVDTDGESVIHGEEVTAYAHPENQDGHDEEIAVRFQELEEALKKKDNIIKQEKEAKELYKTRSIQLEKQLLVAEDKISSTETRVTKLKAMFVQFIEHTYQEENNIHQIMYKTFLENF